MKTGLLKYRNLENTVQASTVKAGLLKYRHLANTVKHFEALIGRELSKM